jgi:hypothetical protein
MKRLRKALHVALVWITVLLLFVDPAAACRLMGRRCCRCCCAPASCEVDMPAMQVEVPPSGVPPLVAGEAGQLPTAPLAGPSPAVDQTMPVERESAQGVKSGQASITPTAPASPSAFGSATLQPAFSETSPAAPLALPSLPRRAPEIAPSALAPVIAPTTTAGSATESSPAVELPGPAPALLRPRQSLEPTSPAKTAEASDPSRQPLTDIRPAAPPAVAHDANPPLPAPSSAASATKLPAAVQPPPRTAPIQPPAFPPVSDDPFALPPPAAAAPRSPAPVDDDPFAPLPKPAEPPKQPTPPLTAEPTSRIADALLPAADGRLPVREWVDTSGQFRVKARLILILDGKVRLLKETGRTTTVVTERLSSADRKYVAEVVARYGNDLSALDQLAAR